ncbi:MAG: HAD family phosphatase [Lachnospiraceae bacterium]|nr:HAD family phosphatase [Lachnospiraceae bacterium]
MKAVIFDMDGVLFDTERLCMEAWMAVAGKWGLPKMEEVFPQCIGLNANDSREVVCKAYGRDFDYPLFREETAAWFEDCVNRRGLPVKPGVREILEWLKESGFRVGLASSTKEATVRSHLELAGLSEYFTRLTTGDMVEHSKPRPDIYLLACDRLGVEPGQTYAVEDSPNGVRAAHAAGMRTVMVPDMVAPDEEMVRLSCAVLRDLTEVQAFLKQRTETA